MKFEVENLINSLKTLLIMELQVMFPCYLNLYEVVTTKTIPVSIITYVSFASYEERVHVFSIVILL